MREQAIKKNFFQFLMKVHPVILTHHSSIFCFSYQVLHQFNCISLQVFKLYSFMYARCGLIFVAHSFKKIGSYGNLFLYSRTQKWNNATIYQVFNKLNVEWELCYFGSSIIMLITYGISGRMIVQYFECNRNENFQFFFMNV